jgi:hypothetical protein
MFRAVVRAHVSVMVMFAVYSHLRISGLNVLRDRVSMLACMNDSKWFYRTRKSCACRAQMENDGGRVSVQFDFMAV